MFDVVQNNLPWIAFLALTLSFFSLILSLVSFLKTLKTDKKNKMLFSGKNGQNLESVIFDQAESLKELDKEVQDLFEISNRINSLAQHSLYKVGIIRYNPFKDLGGDQSFAIALLDGKNSGFVLSSLHTREGTRVYAKPIMRGQSKKYPLTEEEKQAIKIASPAKELKI